SPSTANVTSIEEWNYWAGDQNTVAPQVPDRRTIISYKTDSTLTSKNILNRPQSIILRVGLIDQVSQTNYDYDGNPLTPINQSIFNHTDSADVHRGNLTHVARWTGGTSFLDTFLTYDTTGQVVQIKDPAGNPTGLTYTDNFFNDNGTSQLPPVTPSQATNAYPSIVTLPASGILTSDITLALVNRPLCPTPMASVLTNISRIHSTGSLRPFHRKAGPTRTIPRCSQLMCSQALRTLNPLSLALVACTHKSHTTSLGFRCRVRCSVILQVR